MKKVTAILLALFLLLGVTACRRRESLPEPEPPSSESEAEPESEPEPLPEPESSSESEEESEPADTEGAQKAAEEMLAALQTGSREEIQAHVDYKNLLQLESDNGADENALAVLARLQYEIEDVTAREDTATVTARLTNINMAAVLPAFNKSAMDMEYNNAISDAPATDEEMAGRYRELFRQSMDDNAGDTLSRSVELRLIRNGDSWRVQVSEELREAATGNYFSAKKQAGQNAGGGQN